MAAPRERWERATLGLILAVSVLLRAILILRGGQGFWPDETRYGFARAAAVDLVSGAWRQAAGELFGHADHILFRLVGLPVALVEQVTGERAALPAMYFGLFSVLAIWLVWKLVLRAGGDEREALWAAFFAASANSLFFYSRHYFPYDAALAGMLASLYVGLGPFGWKRSFCCGILAGAAFLTYNGYWLLGAVVLGAHVLFGDGKTRRAPARALLAVVGLAAPIVLMAGLSSALGFHPIDDYRHNAGTVMQGDFGLGYRVLVEYFWSAEGPLALVWLVGAAWAVFHARAGGIGRRVSLWTFCLAGIAAGLLLFSDIVPRFVIYGRLARELTPFLCLLAGAGVRQWLARRSDASRWPALAAWGVCGIAAVNFLIPLRQIFPADFSDLAGAAMRQANAAGPSSFRNVFIQDLWGVDVEGVPVPRGDVILHRPHPLQYKPYQFEGLDAAMRKKIDRTDIAMRTIRTFGPLVDVQRWGGFPGPVRMTVRFPTDRVGWSDPLVTSGITGAGDFIFVKYVDSGHVVFGHDNWGRTLDTSAPVAIDYARPHEISIIAGNLVPPPGSEVYASKPVLDPLRGRLDILLDDHPVMFLRSEFHPTAVSDVYFGLNFIGGSAVGQTFGGEITAIASLPEDMLERTVPTLMAGALGKQRGPEWAGAIGPMKITFDPPPPGPEAYPLLSVGRPGSGQVVFIMRENADTVRLGLERAGLGAILSEPLPGLATPMTLEVSLGSMLPAEGAPLYLKSRPAETLRDRAVLRLNDQPVISASLKFEPASEVALGVNSVGGTIPRPYYAGLIRSVSLLEPEAVQTGIRLDDFISPTVAEKAGRYVGPLRIELQFPRGRAGVPEPILVAGETGFADFLYVLFDSEYTLRFGFDHWGVGGRLSDPIEFEPGRLYHLDVSFGSFYPAPGSDYYKTHPAAAAFRNRLYLALDGVPVFNVPSEFHPLVRDLVTIGQNDVGGSTAGNRFTGRIRGLAREGPESLVTTRFQARSGWGGYPGPLEFRVQFPANPVAGTGEPLVSTGSTGAGDFLFVRYEGNGLARLGFDHWGMSASVSEPFPLEPGREHVMVLSMGSLFPPPGHAIYASQPELSSLRGRMIVILDGNRLLDVAKPSHPSQVDQITIGTNAIGGSSAGSSFGGRLSVVGLAPPVLAAP